MSNFLIFPWVQRLNVHLIYRGAFFELIKSYQGGRQGGHSSASSLGLSEMSVQKLQQGLSLHASINVSSAKNLDQLSPSVEIIFLLFYLLSFVETFGKKLLLFVKEILMRRVLEGIQCEFKGVGPQLSKAMLGMGWLICFLRVFMMDVSESFNFIWNCYDYYHRKLFKVVLVQVKDPPRSSKRSSTRVHIIAVARILIII